MLDKDRLFPTEQHVRALARELYEGVHNLPIISPHGHTDPRWFAENDPFPDPTNLFVTPDHYVFRMLHSQGIPLDALGVPRVDGGASEQDTRKIWRLFAKNFHLFRGTPSRLWIDHAFQEVFGISQRLSEDTADAIYDQIADRHPDERAAEDDDHGARRDPPAHAADEHQTAENREWDGVGDQVAETAVQERGPENAVDAVDRARADAIALQPVVQGHRVEDLDDPHHGERHGDHARSAADPGGEAGGLRGDGRIGHGRILCAALRA